MNENGKPKLAVLYARFSPRPNAAECESCERQFEDLRSYCKSSGMEVVGEFSDRAISGGDKWEDRPGMLDAVASCKKGYVFLVRSYDRLFRDTDKGIAFQAMMESKGVEVRSITEEGANGDSMNAKLIRFVYLWLAESQREINRARTKLRMLQKQDKGMLMSKLPPWGRRVDPSNPKRLIVNDAEMAVARDIVRMKGEGASLRDIAAWLEQNNVDRRGKTTWDYCLVNRIYQRHKGAA